MTVEELRKEVGIIDTRILTIVHEGKEIEETYWLGKTIDGDEYYIGFTKGGYDYCNYISEEEMLHYLNNKNASEKEAMGIYLRYPKLSGWLFR